MIIVTWLWQKFSFYLIAGMALAGAVLTVYLKGRSDQKAWQKKRQEEVVSDLHSQYQKINDRTDGISDVVRRLRDGSF